MGMIILPLRTRAAPHVRNSAIRGRADRLIGGIGRTGLPGRADPRGPPLLNPRVQAIADQARPAAKAPISAKAI